MERMKKGGGGEQEDGCFQQLMVLPSPPGLAQGRPGQQAGGKTLERTAVFDNHYSSSSHLFSYLERQTVAATFCSSSTFITAGSDRVAAFNGKELQQDESDGMNEGMMCRDRRCESL